MKKWDLKRKPTIISMTLRFRPKTTIHFIKIWSFACIIPIWARLKKALHHLELFSKQTDYHYWTILFVQMDPLLDNLKDLPEFKKLSKKIENKFWENHEDIKTSLEGKGLI
jgi:hypothetical protein